MSRNPIFLKRPLVDLEKVLWTMKEFIALLSYLYLKFLGTPPFCASLSLPLVKK